MRPRELEAFRAKYGYDPTPFSVAVDALAVFVNADNPLEEITATQIDAVWSKTRRRGGSDIATWGDLGLKGEWADKPVSLYGRNSASGTYGFFKEQALLNGDFKDQAKEQPGTASLVLQVHHDRYGMGYGGIGYRAGKTKALKIVAEAGKPAVAPTQAGAADGSYLLGRRLYIYVNQPPRDPLEPAVREFLSLALSREGQEIVVKDGYFPLTAAQAAEEKKKLK